MPRCNICVCTSPVMCSVSGRKYATAVPFSSTSRRSILPSGAGTSLTTLNLSWYAIPRTGPITFCSPPHDDVMSATASLRLCNRSLNTPVIIASGIRSTRTSAPTPSSLIIVLWRFPNEGWDFGNGGGAVWPSGMPRCWIRQNRSGQSTC